MQLMSCYDHVKNISVADWELGYVTAELYSGRFFKKDTPQVVLKTVSGSKKAIHTMGGITVIPDCLIEDMVVRETSVLLLPGANTWSEPRHGAILEKVREFLELGATVFAICGATSALAGAGLFG